MKYALISCREKHMDDPICEDFVVEYTPDFREKCRELEELQVAHDAQMWCDESDELSEEQKELLEKYGFESEIETVENYIYKNFKVIDTCFEDVFEVEW